MGGLEIAAIEAGAPAGSGTAGGAVVAGPPRHVRAAVLLRFRRPDAGHRRAGQDRRPAAAERRRALRARRALLRADGRPVARRRRLRERHHHRRTVRRERAVYSGARGAARAAAPAAIGPARRHGGRCGAACPHLRRGRHAEAQHRPDAGRAVRRSRASSHTASNGWRRPRADRLGPPCCVRYDGA